jgi:Flp pilus assembly protein TadG
MFLASVDLGRAIAIYMKVRAATYTLDAVANQYSTIQSSDMTDILGAASAVLAPYSSATTAVTVSQIKVISAANAKVNWSATRNGSALAVGSSVSVPANFASCASYPCYLIYGQVTYTYTPLFTYLFNSSFTLADNLFITPRSTLCVMYPPQNITTSPC